MISQCPHMWLLQELFIRAWPSSCWPTLLRWWSSAHPAERRHFIRTLIPASLHSALFTSLSPAPDHWAQLLSSRRSAITAAVSACRDWLQSNTPPVMPSHPKSINYFRTPDSVYSTSYIAESHKRPRHHAYSPPDPIPSQVKKRKAPSPSVRTQQSMPSKVHPPPPATQLPTHTQAIGDSIQRSTPLPKLMPSRKRVKMGQG